MQLWSIYAGGECHKLEACLRNTALKMLLHKAADTKTSPAWSHLVRTKVGALGKLRQGFVYVARAVRS